jgi:hypothetical protein
MALSSQANRRLRAAQVLLYQLPHFVLGSVVLEEAALGSLALFLSPPDRIAFEHKRAVRGEEHCPASANTLSSEVKRTDFVGGPIQREDGTHGTTQQAFPGGA